MPRWSLLRPREGQWSDRPISAPTTERGDGQARTDHCPLNTDNWSGEAIELAAMQLLLRYGIMARDLLRLEQLPLTWSELYDAYLRLEMQGKVVRGYYVEGLAGAQFALPAAHEELTDGGRDRGGQADSGLLINMCDPANMYGPGALFPLTAPQAAAPLQVARAPSNYLLLRSGRPVACLELGATRLTALEEVAPADLEQLLRPLRSLLDSPWPVRPFRRARIEFWGHARVPKDVSAALQDVGFVRGHRGLTLADG